MSQEGNSIFKINHKANRIRSKRLEFTIKANFSNWPDGNHSIFRHDNFIGCFSADKIKMSARKYFCFNIS
ncbi:hypothetical protein, partial [uncultured Bacteroides sp.]|uniref:hypothetical protein n=1 Tax=uncultured Bacteroides sp. TaxID=162156 RepID=UPI00262425E1